MLSSILTTGDVTVTLQQFALCTLCSLALGVVAALLFMVKNDNYTPSFAAALALLPVIVQVVILLVNGNLGTGVAIMGAFSLIRFRSVPGSARDITAIFLAMALGLCTGMGYLGVAVLLTAVVGLGGLALQLLHFGSRRAAVKTLRITIPESLDYTGVFDDLFAKYTTAHRLVRVRTTNMGSLFELDYTITLRDEKQEKQFIDDLRCRNGNLRIDIGQSLTPRDSL